MPSIAEAYMRLRVDSAAVKKDTEKGLAAASEGSAAEKAGAVAGQKYAAGMGKAVKIAAAATVLAVAAVGYESTRAAITFQASMEKVHTQAGASQQSVERLSKSVLDLAGSGTQQGPVQLADALYHLKSVGLDDADAMRALKVASDLAAVGGANLEDTTNALAGAWRTGIRGAHDFGQAAGTVNAIIGAGNMRMQDFVAAIGTGILPSAKTFGLSMAQVGAALALMTDEGVPAVDAATRLRMSMSLLGAPSGVAEKELERIGLTGLQLADAMRGPRGLIGAIQLLKDHLEASGMTASQQAQVLSRAFGGGRSSSAILTLVNNLDVLKIKQEQINRTMGNFGPAVEAQRKTAQAQFAILRSEVETLGVRLGTLLLPAATAFAHVLNSDVVPALAAAGRVTGEFVGWIQKASDPAVILTSVLAGLTAGLIVYKTVTEGVVIATRAWIGVQFLLNQVMKANVFVLILTALVALGVALFTAYERSKTFRDIINGVFREVGKVAGDVIGWFEKTLVPFFTQTLPHAFDVAFSWVKAHWPLLLGILTGPIGLAAYFIYSHLQQIIGFFQGIINWVTTNFDKWWAQNGDSIKTIWAAVWGAVSTVFHAVWDPLVTAVKAGWEVITAIWQLGTKQLAAEWDILWKIISTAAQIAWTLVTTIIKAGWVIITTAFALGMQALRVIWNTAWAVIVGLLKTAWAAVVAILKIGWDLIVGIFTIAIDILTGKWGKAWNDLKTMLGQIWNAMTGVIKTALGSFWTALTTFFDGVMTYVKGVPGRILGALGKLRGLLYGAGKDVIQGLLDGLLYIWNKVKSFISGVGGWIKAHKGPLPLDRMLLEPAGRAIMSGLLTGLLTGFGPVGAFVGGITGMITGALGGGVTGTVGVSTIGASVGQTIAMQIGQQMAAAVGWAGNQWAALQALWMRESGWQWDATNPTSGAYGVPQALPGDKMASAGADWRTNPATQIAWGLGYIAQRYGSPVNAWAHEQRFNWYGSGTLGAAPGWAVVGERGPELIHMRGGETVIPDVGGRFAFRGYANGTGGAGAVMVHIDQLVVREEADIHLIAQRLGFLVTASGA